MRVLNIGSLNIDYVYDVERFVSRGETISSADRSTFPGGKGLNQSLALGRAGVEVAHAGLIGAEGIFLRELLAESGVDVGLVRTMDGCPTGHAVIQRVPDGDNCIILFGGANHCVDEAFVDEAIGRFMSGDWLLLQNETSCLAHAIEAAKQHGMRVAVNPSPADDGLTACPLELVDCFVLNEGEAARLSGRSGGVDEMLSAMCERFPDASVVLTMGEGGSACAEGGVVTTQMAFRVDAVDTTAAGDTFTGYYLAECARGASASEALRVASAAAAIAVSRVGAAPSIPARAEVEKFLAGRHAPDLHAAAKL
ncbi:MAG: ribokinase [Coriobacteriaceae bacterium]|nr:ribokinase [Coriobacteriaceae bacterium]